MRLGSAEQYKRAFARQRARDLAQHADALLSKDKEIAALQQECRELEAQVGTQTVPMTQTASHGPRECVFSHLRLVPVTASSCHQPALCWITFVVLVLADLRLRHC